MSLGLTLITPPAQEPISLETAKNHLRVEITEDDSLISTLIVAARRYGENRLRRQFITATWMQTRDYLPANGFGFPIERCLWIPRPPLQSVVSLNYYDLQGNFQTFSPTLYSVDTNSEPGRICLMPYQIWPLTQRMRANTTEITFTSGYGSNPSDVPENIQQAMLLLIGHWYQNRSDIELGTIATQIPKAADVLFDLSDFGFYG